MRTTLNVDDDVLRAVKELAKLQSRPAGKVLSELARRTLERERSPATVRNGVPLLSRLPGEGIVTPDLVGRLQDDE